MLSRKKTVPESFARSSEFLRTTVSRFHSPDREPNVSYLRKNMWRRERRRTVRVSIWPRDPYRNSAPYSCLARVGFQVLYSAEFLSEMRLAVGCGRIFLLLLTIKMFGVI